MWKYSLNNSGRCLIFISIPPDRWAHRGLRHHTQKHTEIVRGNLTVKSHGIGCLIECTIMPIKYNIRMEQLQSKRSYRSYRFAYNIMHIPKHLLLGSLSCHCHSWFCWDGIYVIHFLHSDQFKLFALDLIGQLLYACSVWSVYCTAGHPSLWVNAMHILCCGFIGPKGNQVDDLCYAQWNIWSEMCTWLDVFKLKFVAKSIEMSRINSL